MNTCERESFQLKKAYEDALPSINTAAERIQIAMRLESGVFDDRRQLVVAPWHMPLPRELQGQPQKGHLQHIKAAPDATKSELDIDTRPDKQAPFGPRPKRGRRRGRPSNQLERSLHNKTLAQNIATFETQMSAALQARDASLPPPAKGPRHPFKADELMSKILKRKLSMVRIPPAPRDGPLDGEVPNLVDQPDVQFYRRMTGRITSKVDVRLKTGKREYPKIVDPEAQPDSSSPPHRRSMPPIEAVLAHGFKNIELKRPVESVTPRSHADDPWTNLTLSHKTLSHTPAFLLNMSFYTDDNNDAHYWKPSLPMIISHHFGNPATLVEETPIQSLTFRLPPSNPFLVNRKQPRSFKQAHHQTEGPESGTEVRMIRMILPPALNADTGSDEEVPHTDWLLFCLSSSSTVATPATRVLRSSSLAPKDPYLLITIPTYAIVETVLLSNNPGVAAEGSATEGSAAGEKKSETYTTELKFILRGKLPLMFGMGRDTGFMDKWIKGFGMGEASLEVEVVAGNMPCWL